MCWYWESEEITWAKRDSAQWRRTANVTTLINWGFVLIFSNNFSSSFLNGTRYSEQLCTGKMETQSFQGLLYRRGQDNTDISRTQNTIMYPLLEWSHTWANWWMESWPKFILKFSPYIAHIFDTIANCIFYFNLRI